MLHRRDRGRLFESVLRAPLAIRRRAGHFPWRARYPDGAVTSERLVRTSGRLAAQMQSHAQRAFPPAVITDRPSGFLEAERTIELLRGHIGGAQFELHDGDAGGQR